MDTSNVVRLRGKLFVKVFIKICTHAAKKMSEKIENIDIQLSSRKHSATEELFQAKAKELEGLYNTESNWLISYKDSATNRKMKKIIKEVDFSNATRKGKSKSLEYEDESDEVEKEGEHVLDNKEEEKEEGQERTEEESISSESVASVYSKLSPFTVKWSFGVQTCVELLNLTTEAETEIFYVASHFGVIFDYRQKKMRFLPGHNFPIRSISADASGRWLVSADSGEDTVIIIWDNARRLPAWSLYNVFPGGVSCVKMSQDARFLAAVNCNFNYNMKFWRWTMGREEPDGTIELDPVCGMAKHIDFNHRKTEQLAVTMKFNVTFCEWVQEKKLFRSYTPRFEMPKKKMGTLRESIFLDDNHTVLTSTCTGYLIVWCDVTYSEPILENTQGVIEKNYMKAVRIHKSGITSLRLCDKVLVSSSEDGFIYFHDQDLRLMYLLPKLKLDPIVSVSFNISDSKTDPFEVGSSPKKKSADVEGAEDEEGRDVEDIPCDTDVPDSGQWVDPPGNDEEEFSRLKTSSVNIVFQKRLTFEHKTKRIPSDCTIEMRPFVIRDFVFLTATGKIGYLSHQRKKIKYFLHSADSPVLTLSCSPNKNHLVVSYSSECVILYNYLTKKAMVSVRIHGTRITSLTYSHLGHILLAGTENGTLMELDPLLLTVKGVVGTGKSPIQKTCFSTRDDLLASYDQQSTVSLYVKNQGIGKKKWIFLGKYVSHYKPICDILFEEHPGGSKRPRLFTIGEDRMLVEYDTVNLEQNKLKLLQVYRIEQTAIPCCFTWHPNFHTPNQFLISNSEYKLKVVDSNTHICQKTTLGPTADKPITKMRVLPTKEKPMRSAKMIYATEKHIGIKILPSTGNPFEGMGMVAHPDKISALGVSKDCKYVFTAGSHDPCILMWELNPNSVDVACQIGGVGLEPFVSLIEGGSNSFFFREIEDFFYYAQIIHQGEDPNLDRSVSKSLALCEIPDLFRALGYYPTDYEVNNVLYELKHIKFHETGETVTEVSFEECVKAFLNHKPVQGISLGHINKALMAIADLSDPTDILVERTELYKALEETAEAMDHKEVVGYLCILLLPTDENNPIPATLSLSDFASHVLGIDLTISEENVKQITHPFKAKKSVSDSQK